MKKQQLILQLYDFINNYTKENTKNLISSNTLYNYFCFLYQKNTKEFPIQKFMPYFLIAYKNLYNKQLNKRILKQNNTTIRCFEDIEIIPCNDFTHLLTLKKDTAPGPTFASTLRSTLFLHSTQEDNLRIQNGLQTELLNGSTSRSTSVVDLKVDHNIKPNFDFMQEWLETYCSYEKDSINETPIHILKENYSKLYLNNINIDNNFNRTFVANIEKIGNIIWPGSNFKKEDRKRKQNTAFIRGLILKNYE